MTPVQIRGLLDFLKERNYHVGKDPWQKAYVEAMARVVGEEPEGSANSVYIDAPAGTGKTSLATLTGVYAVERCGMDKILYLRTEDDVAGVERGFLPGDDDAKFDPYKGAFIEAMDEAYPGLFEKWAMVDEELKQIKQYGKANKALLEQKAKAVATHPGHFRGKTRENVFVIIDEAQNWRMGQLQAVYTRFKNNAIIVTIGHSGQVDLPDNKREMFAGLLPFQVFALHHRKHGAWIGTLETNYRGPFAKWSDEVMQTVAELQKEQPSHLLAEWLKMPPSLVPAS